MSLLYYYKPLWPPRGAPAVIGPSIGIKRKKKPKKTYDVVKVDREITVRPVEPLRLEYWKAREREAWQEYNRRKKENERQARLKLRASQKEALQQALDDKKRQESAERVQQAKVLWRTALIKLREIKAEKERRERLKRQESELLLLVELGMYDD